MGTIGTSYHVGGVCMALSVFMSIFLIMQHRRWYATPSEQMLIILIILMVPIFALNSFVGLWFVYDSKFTGVAIENEYVDTLLDGFKECWEAVTIWAFLQLMYAYVGVDASQPVPKKLKVIEQ